MADEVGVSNKNAFAQNEVHVSIIDSDKENTGPTVLVSKDIENDVTTSADKFEPAVAQSTNLEEIMIERTRAINNIRSLLNNELEQDNIIIAEFSEKVVELEDEIASKSSTIERLSEVSRKLDHELDQKKKENEEMSQNIASVKKSYAEEFKNLTTTIDELVASNTGLEARCTELTKINEDLTLSLEATKKQNDTMEVMVSSLTNSLKDSKHSFDREALHNEKLQKEKDEWNKSSAKVKEEHRIEIDLWKKKLDEESTSKAALKKETETLRKALCEEQQNNTKLSALETNLDAAEKSMVKLMKEKNRVTDELVKAQESYKKLEKTIGSDPTIPLKKELNALRDALCKEQQNNTQLICLKARLEETERYLKKVTEEKNKIRAELIDCQVLKEEFSSETSKTESKSEYDALLVEKKQLQKRLRESEKALVLVAKEKEELASLYKESKKKEVLFEPIREKQSMTLSSEKEKIAAELAKVQLKFYKEKKELMRKQNELEGMLIEALKDRLGDDNQEMMSKLAAAQSSYSRQKKGTSHPVSE